MFATSKRPYRVTFLTTFIVCLLAAGILPAHAATTSKQFSLDVGNHAVGAGHTDDYGMTLTNESVPQALGSAEITPPAGFTIVGSSLPNACSPTNTTGCSSVSGNVIHLRTLNLTTPPVSFTVRVEAPCVAGSYSWAAQAKQSNDFNGPPGNAFLLDTATSRLSTAVSSACSLAFSRQPTDAKTGTKITGTAYDTGAPGVEVSVLSAPAPDAVLVPPAVASISLGIGVNPSGATLRQPASPVAVTGGKASFSTLSINLSGQLYRLVATTTAAGITSPSPSSAQFDITDFVFTCTSACDSHKLKTDDGNTAGQVTTTSGGLLTISFGTFPLDCPDYVEPPTATMTFTFSGTGQKTALYTIGSAVVDRPASKYEACYASPRDANHPAFTTLGGGLADAQTIDGQDLWVGLLPPCAIKSPVAPCLVGSPKANKDGSVTLTILAPAGDPHIQ